MNRLLRVEGVTLRRRQRVVLSCAGLQCDAGTVTALVGRNGAGKTTLLRVAAGFTRPQLGTVEFREHRYALPRAAVLARAGMLLLPVDRSLLSPAFSLGQHLDALERRFGARDERSAVLERLGLGAREHVPCRALSGGERRWAELALALLRRPHCLLVDEPFRGLDPRHAEQVSAELRGLAASGCGVVVTGHELGWMMPVADQVVWLHDAVTHALGPPSAAREHWLFRREYLGAARV